MTGFARTASTITLLLAPPATDVRWPEKEAVAAASAVVASVAAAATAVPATGTVQLVPASSSTSPRGRHA